MALSCYVILSYFILWTKYFDFFVFSSFDFFYCFFVLREFFVSNGYVHFLFVCY